MSGFTHSHTADVLLVTVTEGETRAVRELFLAKTGRRATTQHRGGQLYDDLGTIAGASIWLVRSEMGGLGPGSAFTTISKAISGVAPAAIIMVGIAFGTQPKKQRLGDVLVARQIVCYEPQRIGTGSDGAPVILMRGDRVRSSPTLLARCCAGAAQWADQDAKIHIGPVLSGEKLLDHQPTVAQLLAHEPEAIGGEMEGAALYTAASEGKVDWILIKAISDWADGQKGTDKQGHQELAARNAAAFTLHVLERGGFARSVSAWPAVLSLAADGLEHKLRVELLDLLQHRYAERLDSALAQRVRLQIGLHTLPAAVDPAWRRLHLRGSLESRPLPSDIPLLELFEVQQRQLLVLGAPGAGKTTLMLELAQALLARAQGDVQARIPVLLNLATWRSGQSLRDWLVPMLRELLGASKRYAERLVKSNSLLLLLDGLDEVAEVHRAACVTAINAYLNEADLAPPLVVGCRSREFAGLKMSLAINGAVELEPLELPAITQALAREPAAQGVLAALETDPLLPELARTPLMVNVLLLAHAGQQVPAVQAQSVEERRRTLWMAYVRRMIWQQPLKHGDHTRSLAWMRWVAQMLQAHSQTDLLLDDLRSTVLPVWPWQRLYTLLMLLLGALGGSLFGFCLGVLLVAAVIATRTDFPKGLYHPVIVPGVSAFVGGLSGSVFLWVTKQARAERLEWKWKSARDAAPASLKEPSFILVGLLLSMLVGVLCFSMSVQSGNAEKSVYFGLIGAVSGFLSAIIIYCVMNMYFHGWGDVELDIHAYPVQGIFTSLKIGFIRWFINMCAVGVSFSLGVGVMGMAIGSIAGQLKFGSADGWLSGLMSGAQVGILAGLLGGLVLGFFVGIIPPFVSGFAPFVQHYTIRLLLARANLLPFHAVTFLDAMASRLLLERDGAFYRFRHILLRDFFAELTDDDVALLAGSPSQR